MKVWILLALTLLVFSGCSTKTQNRQLRAMNAKQAQIIRQQRAQINALESKIKTNQLIRQAARTKRKKVNYASQGKIPTAPKKHVELKKVEDSNYSADYMYPGAKKRIPKKTPAKTSVKPTKVENKTKSTAMTKAECISMIGEAKFDKYTQMFGNEAASLKRCKMLKAMK